MANLTVIPTSITISTSSVRRTRMLAAVTAILHERTVHNDITNREAAKTLADSMKKPT